MWRGLITLVTVAGLMGAAYGGWLMARQPGRFPLREVRVLGADHTDLAKSLATLGIVKGGNLLAIDPVAVRKEMLLQPWVRTAEATRKFPDVLEIKLQEKKVLCLGRDGERLWLLDEYGQKIKPLAKGDPVVLPVVTTSRDGSGSEGAIKMMALLAEHPWLQGHISEAINLAGDRWVLYTMKGVKLLLPANPRDGLGVLKRLQDQFSILDRRIRQIDMRISGKAAVRPDYAPAVK